MMALTYATLMVIAATTAAAVAASSATGNRSLEITALRCDATCDRVIIARENGAVSLWDRAKGVQWTAPGGNRRALAAYFVANQTQALVVEQYGDIRIHDIVSGRLAKRLTPDFRAAREGHADALVAADIDPSGTWMALASAYFATVVVLNVNALLAQAQRSPVLLADGQYSVSASGVSLWSRGARDQIASPAVVGCLQGGPDTRFTDVRFCSGEKVLAVTSTGQLVAWDKKPNEASGALTKKGPWPQSYLRKVASGPSPDKALLGLACSTNGFALTVGYGSKYGQGQLWRVETGEMLQSIALVDPGTARRAVFNHTGSLALTTGDLGYRLWNVGDSKLDLRLRVYFKDIARLDSLPNAVDFSAKGDVVAFAEGQTAFLMSIPKQSIEAASGPASHTPKILEGQ
jgi:WD40 repeat protein